MTPARLRELADEATPGPWVPREVAPHDVGDNDMSVTADLLPIHAVYHDHDLLCWLPRESHTRTQARYRFWRETNAATWNVAWTRIRVVACHVRLDHGEHPDRGVYVQCSPDAPGATPVWRCETLGSDGRPMTETALWGRVNRA